MVYYTGNGPVEVELSESELVELAKRSLELTYRVEVMKSRYAEEGGLAAKVYMIAMCVGLTDFVV